LLSDLPLRNLSAVAQQTCEGLGGGCEGVVGRADQQDAVDRGGRLQWQDADAGADALQGQGRGGAGATPMSAAILAWVSW
jgi:hypothetical protein